MKSKVLYVVIFVLLVFSAYSTTMLFKSRDYKYEFLAKRVQQDNPNKVVVKFVGVREKLEQYINQLKDPTVASIYFEYLPTGVSIKINENSEQVAASLMKVPVVMDVYKASELGYINLNDKMKLKADWLDDEYGSLYKKGAGYEISVKDAVDLVLKESDNTAFLAIWDKLNGSNLEYVDKSLNYLDVNFNLRKDERVEISPESYSSLLKCLYFSCFNSFSDSNEILQTLTESKFMNRLVKKLPSDLKVAHKIGAFSKINQSDCGIVYLDKKNYILCVMVKGDDPTASKIIADISEIVYENLKNK